MLMLCALISIAMTQAHCATKLTDGVEVKVDEGTAVIEGELNYFHNYYKISIPSRPAPGHISNNEHDKTVDTQHLDGNSPVTIKNR